MRRVTVITTLVLVALVILGAILAMVALNSRRSTTRVLPLLQLASAIEMFWSDVGCLPTTLAEMAANDRGERAGESTRSNSLPVDSWGRAITYVVLNTNEFELRSSGVDGLYSNDDDIVVRGGTGWPRVVQSDLLIPVATSRVDRQAR